MLPVVEAGLSQLVDGAAQLDENLKVEPAPGHTPGTIAIKFESRGEKALFRGDILHHALQVYNPEWNSFDCAEAVGARKSQREALEHCAGSGARLMPPFRRAVHCTSTTREAVSCRASTQASRRGKK